MRQPIDVLVTEAARRSAREAPAAARMATVSAVNGDGTVDVAIADGEIPRVRCLTQIYRPGVVWCGGGVVWRGGGVVWCGMAAAWCGVAVSWCVVAAAWRGVAASWCGGSNAEKRHSARACD